MIGRSSFTWISPCGSAEDPVGLGSSPCIDLSWHWQARFCLDHALCLTVTVAGKQARNITQTLFRIAWVFALHNNGQRSLQCAGAICRTASLTVSTSSLRDKSPCAMQLAN